MSLKTQILVSNDEEKFFEVNDIIEVDEFVKLSVRLPAGATYNVNLSEIANANVLAVDSRFTSGPNSGNRSRFVATYQNANFTSNQNIDCFGFVLLNIDETFTQLQINNPDATDEIRINLFLGSE